jgi:acetyl esterase/lipase
MASVTSDRLQLEGEPEVGGVSSAVQAAVAFFPPVDFLTMDAQTIEQRETYGLAGSPIILHDDPSSPESLLVGGPIQDRPEAAAAASPLTYATGAEPPTAIFHGTHDPLLPPGQSLALYQALRDAGAPVRLTLVHGSGHEVIPPPDDAPPRPFEVGEPIIDAAETTSWAAIDGIEQAGSGLRPTWDAIAEFVSSALDGAT